MTRLCGAMKPGNDEGQPHVTSTNCRKMSLFDVHGGTTPSAA